MTQDRENPAVDFNIHGLVTVRFNNPSANALASFRGRLGPVLHPPVGREPDISVSFADQIAATGLRYVGQNQAAYDNQAFYLLDAATGALKASLPFDQIGHRPHIICRRDTGSVPLLADIINLAFVARGYVPVHAAGFVYDGTGIVVMGWPKGGKTGALLAFMNHGAEFIGDEWLLLSVDGQPMLGLPSPVSLAEWQLNQMPGLAPRPSLGQRAMFAAIHALDAAQQALARGRFKKSFPAKTLAKATPSLKRQLKIYKAPQKLFKNQIDRLQAPAEKLFWIIAHDRPDIAITPRPSADIARRMAIANQREQGAFWDAYSAFRYAFPDRPNDFLDGLIARQRAMLFEALGSLDSYELAHPYGGPLENLFEAMLPYCRPQASQPGADAVPEMLWPEEVVGD